MDTLIYLALAAGGIVLVIVLVRKLFRFETIYPWDEGLLYVNGQFRRALKPGRHWLFFPLDQIGVFRVGVRQQVFNDRPVNVSSADRLHFRLTASIVYQVTDPRVFHEKESFSLLHDAVAAALTRMAAEQTLVEFLDARASQDAKLTESLAGALPEIAIVSARISAVQLPPEVRRMFAEVERAKFEGLAALERARGEQAALRSLANAARLLKDNPELKSLRLLQSVSAAGKGATIVLGHDALVGNGSGSGLTES